MWRERTSGCFNLTGALALILRHGSVLLIERGVEPHLGYWCPPGGVQDEGEPLEETARRETEEETGLDVVVVDVLGEVVGPITGHTHVIFLCSPTKGSPRPRPPETTDVKWVPYGDLHRFVIPPFIREFLGGLDLQELERRLRNR